MAGMMDVKEASKYLKLSEDNIVLLVEAGELEGEQHNQRWRVSRASTVAFRARQLAQENATQGVEDPDR